MILNGGQKIFIWPLFFFIESGIMPDNLPPVWKILTFPCFSVAPACDDGTPFKEITVMANTAAYYGFQQYLGGAGGAPTFAQSVRRIASSNSTAIYCGDPVTPVAGTGAATGYITASANGAQPIAGIFWGCKYLSTSQKRTVWSRYWPGSDATGDVEAYVIDDPNARFVVQTSFAGAPMTGTATAMTSGIQGQYGTFALGSGNTSTGTSGAYLSGVSTTITSPFIVVDYAIGFGNGGDPTTQYCNVIVGFNNEQWRSNGAGPASINA